MTCLHCDQPPDMTGRSVCRKCYNAQRRAKRPRRGYRKPHCCGYCGERGHTARTCTSAHLGIREARSTDEVCLEMFTLHKAGTPYHELTKLYGMGEGTVYRRLNRAKELLKREES